MDGLLKTRLLLPLLVLLTTFFAVSCQYYQLAEAGKLANEANDIARVALADYQKSEKQLVEILAFSAADSADFRAFKEKNSTRSASLKKDFDKLYTDLNVAADKARKAAAYDVEPALKEGLLLIEQLLQKRAEGAHLWREFLMAFEGEDSPSRAGQLIEEYSNKVTKVNDEAGSLTMRLNKILDENPSLFKK